MNTDFDTRAESWDDESKVRRAEAVAAGMRRAVPLRRPMRALEYGAGTGLLSFCLRDTLGLITLVDSSAGMRAVAERKIAAANASDVRVVDLDLMRDAVPAERYDLFERGVLRPALTAAGFVDVGIDDCFVVEKGPRRYPVFLATARKP